MGRFLGILAVSLFDRAPRKEHSKMSDAAAATAAPAKAIKKRAGGAAKAKKHSDHPTYAEMINASLTALKVCKLTRLFLLSLARQMVKCAPAGMRACSLELVGLGFRDRDTVGVGVSDGVRVSTFLLFVTLAAHKIPHPACSHFTCTSCAHNLF